MRMDEAMKAWLIVVSGAIKRYVFKPLNKELWIVSYYEVLPLVAYCGCAKEE